MKNQKGFTLIEMLIVLLVITILLLITIPNIAKHNANIQSKGCEGLKDMIQAQSSAYEMKEGKKATISDLETEKYINTNKCPNGTTLNLDSEGAVVEEAAE
ncbi:competence type IV pilus major pilin ComGC [Metabacillus sp. RGM 3146]|uniref:competence type IV pilus major pilin ComGC n=1 Tax=Metabacillus sp. RGM 3146 TaxID=3401092 RepID=UPI003B99A87B